MTTIYVSADGADVRIVGDKVPQNPTRCASKIEIRLNSHTETVGSAHQITSVANNAVSTALSGTERMNPKSCRVRDFAFSMIMLDAAFGVQD